MDLQLKEKTAFVSGITQGIGYAIAKQLVRENSFLSNVCNVHNEMGGHTWTRHTQKE